MHQKSVAEKSQADVQERDASTTIVQVSFAGTWRRRGAEMHVVD